MEMITVRTLLLAMLLAVLAPRTGVSAEGLQAVDASRPACIESLQGTGVPPLPERVQPASGQLPEMPSDAMTDDALASVRAAALSRRPAETDFNSRSRVILWDEVDNRVRDGGGLAVSNMPGQKTLEIH